MKNIEKNRIFSRLALISLVLIFSFSLSSCLVLNVLKEPTGTMPDKETLISNIENANGNYRTVNEYLKSFGFTGYNQQKMMVIEANIEFYYYDKSIFNDKKALAVECAELFVEYFYDRTDLTDRAKLTDAIAYCYVEALGDKYSTYRTGQEYDSYESDLEGEFIGIGVSVIYDIETNSIYVSDVLADEPAERAGILKGDYIVAVDGVRVADSEYQTVVNSIRGESGTSVEITLLRNDVEITVTVIRDTIVSTTVSYNVLENGIGYVKISGFKHNTDEQFAQIMQELTEQNVSGIIFDLRGNLGGTLDSVVNMISYLVPNGTEVVSFSAFKDTMYAQEEGEDHVLNIPCAVLCGGDTASAGELFTSALRDYDKVGILDCTVIGTTTYGKGIMQTTIPFTDNSAITLTVAYYNPPSGVNYNGVGITPEYTVQDIEDTEADEQLEYALSYFNKR